MNKDKTLKRKYSDSKIHLNWIKPWMKMSKSTANTNTFNSKCSLSSNQTSNNIWSRLLIFLPKSCMTSLQAKKSFFSSLMRQFHMKWEILSIQLRARFCFRKHLTQKLMIWLMMQIYYLLRSLKRNLEKFCNNILSL